MDKLSQKVIYLDLGILQYRIKKYNKLIKVLYLIWMIKK